MAARSSVLWISFVALIALCAACAGQRTPEAAPMPEGKDFTGVWYSSQFEHMNLRQSGEKVSGVYTYKNGGRIEGEIDGNLLVFEWVEPGDKQKAQRTMKGRGYLQLSVSEEETLLKGEWGYKDSMTGGGPWEAEYVRKLEPDDPLTLEDLEDYDG